MMRSRFSTLPSRAARTSGLVGLGLLLGCSGGGGGSPTAPPGGSRNHAPTINLNISKSVVAYSETASLTAAVADPDGDQLTLAWGAGRGSVQSSGSSATTATYTAPSSWGTDSVVATVSDGQGGSGRASAKVYVRNPGTPAFTLGAVGSATCGPGTSDPTGFVLTITPAEDVLITYISIQPDLCVNTCERVRNYSPPIAVAAGATYTWSDGGCQTSQCRDNSGCGGSGWKVWISGQRPAPDNGTFTYQCNHWSGPGDTNCN